MSICSIFSNFSTKVEDKSIQDILKDIISDRYKDQVENIRDLLSSGKDSEADHKKKLLTAFTVCGTFDKVRQAQSITNYNSHIIIDYDKLQIDQLASFKKAASDIAFTLACFVSPSGKGLKIIVKVDSSLQDHKTAFHAVTSYYDKILGIKSDQSGKDVSRLCFMSYDPQCFRRHNPPVFQVNDGYHLSSVTVYKSSPKSNGISNTIDIDSALKKSLSLTESKLNFVEGQRNNFIHLLACNCNRNGIPENVTLEFILCNYDLSHSEIKTTVQSAYKNNAPEFAKFADSASSHDFSDSISKDEILLSMPYISEDVFTDLPDILKVGCLAFEDKRERDVFLIGALSIISGCMDNVKGLYRGKEHFANLFSFIIAPAASGKGALVFSKILGDKYHDKLVEESRHKAKIYEIEMAEYKKQLSRPKSDTSELEPPVEPPFKVLFIPANNSSARVIQHLQEGDEHGIFCETEADTMGNVFKQDWGSYSELLRKAFHHEPISYSRKTNKEWVEIKKPRLSVALAGTPGQVENLIKSAEDGLFSRFIFYVFKSDTEWIDAGETIGGINLTEYFNKLSEQTLSFVDFLHQNEFVTFRLTEVQWNRLNEYGRSATKSMITFVSEDMSSTSKRLGLILYRICMITTALRYFDNGEITSEIICSDDDFNLSVKLVTVLQEHSIFMFKDLPKSGSITDKTLKKFFDALPLNFKRKEAISIAESMDIKERTADTYLSKLVTNKYLDKNKFGDYTKNLNK
jgi:Protein of unknown function (DUF3987)/VirE N-terminal domain